MRYWYWFWITNLFVCGLAFALVSLVVIVRGAGDLRHMFTRLRNQNPDDEHQ